MMLEWGGGGYPDSGASRPKYRQSIGSLLRQGGLKVRVPILVPILVSLLALAVLAGAAPGTALAQGPSPTASRTTTSTPRSPYACEMVGGQRLAGSRVDVVFRPSTENIRVGETFSLLVLVCPHTGVTAPASVVVDATLPERGARHELQADCQV